jgi:serine phosphatase RsbU (regulator of sigma subunit)
LILRDAGYRVTAAEDGRQAWDLLSILGKKSIKVDLLVTDIQMPGLTGLELIDELKRFDIKLPSLVITGYGDKKTVIELMRKGCSEYLDKPFEPPEFLNRVKTVLEKEELKKEEREKHVSRVEEETYRIKRKVETYKQHFEKLREQVDLAVNAYQSLVETGEDKYNIPIAYQFKPLSEMGGDFIDIKNTETGCDILVADVSGHDMGASFHAVLAKTLFDENYRMGRDGQFFFDLLNKQLIEHGQGKLKQKRILTAVFLRLNLKTMKGEIAAAAHPPIIRLTPAHPLPQRLYTRGSVLGIFEDAEFDYRTFKIEPGHRFFLYTDGITDACRMHGPTGTREKLSGDGLDDLLKKYRHLDLKEMTQHIWQEVFSFCRHKARDDMLLLGVEIPGGSDVQDR